MSTTVAPYRLARLASLFLSFAFGVASFGVGVNALVKSLDDKRRLRNSVPSGTTVAINTEDVFASGIVVTVASGLIALASLLAFPSALSASASARPRFLNVQSAILGFLTTFLFASLVPFTDFVASRQVKVSAFIRGVPIPDAIVRGIEASLGATPVYHDIPYLKNVAIIPWFAFLFGLTSTVLTFLAARRTAAAATTSGFGRNLGSSNGNTNGYAADINDEKKGNVETVQHQV